MAHRRLIFRERITAIIGATLLFTLVALSYYYSIRVQLEGLRYVPSEDSPDFVAHNIVLSDFDDRGIAKQRLIAENVKHFSDERMNAEVAQYLTMNPDKLQLRLSAAKVWSQDGLETIDLQGNVNLERDAGPKDPPLSFQTEYLKGFLDTHQFETNKPVVMRRGMDITSAEGGMTYDNVAHSVELQDQVYTKLSPNNDNYQSSPKR